MPGTELMHDEERKEIMDFTSTGGNDHSTQKAAANLNTLASKGGSVVRWWPVTKVIG